MNKVRLYHLTSEWGLSAQAVLDALQESGRRLKSHYVEIEPEDVPEIRDILADAGMFAEPEEEAPPEGESAEGEFVEGAEGEVAEDGGEAADGGEAEAGGETAVAEEPAPTPTPSAVTSPAAEPVSKPPLPPKPAVPKKEGAPGRPAGVAKGFQGFAPGFDPNARRGPRGPRSSGPPGIGGGPGAGFMPTDPTTTKDGERRRPRGGRTAVSPAKRGRQATRRTGGQAQMGRGRRMQRLLQEREHWYKASSRRPKRRAAPTHVVRPDHLQIQLPISLKDLSAELAIRVTDIMGFLMKEGMMINQNAPVPQEAIEMIGLQYKIDIDFVDEKDVEAPLQELEQWDVDEEDLEPRQPIVAVLGHVDHGKTSLLDKIRQTKAPVADREAGGITQHIGAYVAEHNGQRLTFIDTPGHEAFTAMRARGADVTDLVLLVVAADDGVMPQTKEAIQHAQAAGKKILVALNKIDKANANKDKVFTELSQIEGMQPIEWGGTMDVVPTSAITGEGIDDLLEHILFEAEAMELRANPNQPAWGTVLEAKKTKGRGIVATLLVQDGTLTKGDTVLASRTYGRVRSMTDADGKQLKTAGPGTPIELLGLDDVPEAGDRFYALDKNDDIKAILSKREEELRAQIDRNVVPTDAAGVWETLQEGEVKKVRVVLKADTNGNLQVIKAQLEKLGNDEVRCKIIRDGVGAITTADIQLALAERETDVVVLGYGVTAEGKARSLAREQGVEIRTHRVIYELINEVKDVMAGALEPEEREKVLGTVEIRKVFKASRIGNIAGCFVTDGLVRRNSHVRLARDGIVLWQGDLQSLRRFKDDVMEVRENFECGIKLKGYDDIKEGDLLEVFEIEKIARTLD